MEQMFEILSRRKSRFPSPRGAISVEDLWNLPIKELNQVYKTLSQEKKSKEEDSLILSPSSKEENDLTLRMEVVKHIYLTREKEKQDALALADKEAQKQKIMEIINNKKDSALEQKSLEDLQKMLSEL